MADATDPKIQAADQFADTPEGKQQRWDLELTSAEKALEEWWKEGDEAVQRFRGEKTAAGAALHMFYATITTKRATLYGKQPTVDVARRYADQADDVGRVAAECIQRTLQCDIEDPDDSYTDALRYALEDWTLPGLGVVRVSYEFEEEEDEGKEAMTRDDGSELAPAVPPQKRLVSESAPVDWYYWRDFLYDPARVWRQVRWVAFKNEMSRDAMRKRFMPALAAELGDAAAESLLKSVPLTARAAKNDEERKVGDAWSRAEVWEVWDKETKTVRWLVRGFKRILDEQPDPLSLKGFFPCPRPLMRNTTTTKLVPRTDLALAKPQYDEIDDLTRRINLLQEAVRVAGVYDGTNEGLDQLLRSGTGNKLIPVKGFAALSERGGLAGAIQFLPLRDIVEALTALRSQRQETIALLFQITAQSDVQRGQAVRKKTATEVATEAGYSNTRGQVEQDEFARFASDLSRLRAEVVAGHFDRETIRARSNVDRVELVEAPQPPPMPIAPGMPPPPPPGPPRKVPNEPLIQAALDLIGQDIAQFRIAVRPESISLPDLATLKQEGVEFIGAVSQFLTAVAPLLQFPPVMKALPELMELLQFSLARFRGAGAAEGIVDRLVAKAEALAAQPPAPPQPDPTAQMKAQAEQARAGASIQQTAMETQAAQADHAATMQEIAAKSQADRMKVQGQLAVAAMRPPIASGVA